MKPKGPNRPGKAMRRLLAEAERIRHSGDVWTGDVWGSKELRVADAVWCPHCNRAIPLPKPAKANR